jgi:hypothetical protein
MSEIERLAVEAGCHKIMLMSACTGPARTASTKRSGTSV